MHSTWKVLMAAAVTIAPASAMAAPMSASTYVMKAGASDQYEIRSSELELQSTHDQQIRNFAQKMIHDHTQSTQDVKMAAHEAGMHPAPPMLDAMGRSNMAQLKAAHGQQRDRLFIRQQKMAHQQALQLHQNYAQSGSVPALRRAAGKIAPVVQSHIDMLQGMHG